MGLFQACAQEPRRKHRGNEARRRIDGTHFVPRRLAQSPDLHKINVGENVPGQLRLDLDPKATKLLREAINYCRQQQDNVTTELLQRILKAEEGHIDWLETQLDLIKDLGLQILHTRM